MAWLLSGFRGETGARLFSFDGGQANRTRKARPPAPHQFGIDSPSIRRPFAADSPPIRRGSFRRVWFLVRVDALVGRHYIALAATARPESRPGQE
jgi:hypothetical protein